MLSENEDEIRKTLPGSTNYDLILGDLSHGASLIAYIKRSMDQVINGSRNMVKRSGLDGMGSPHCTSVVRGPSVLLICGW